jgi:uncharacterized membrane protein YcgQ (UPF0703/DUF1980 family)
MSEQENTWLLVKGTIEESSRMKSFFRRLPTHQVRLWRKLNVSLKGVMN